MRVPQIAVEVGLHHRVREPEERARRESDRHDLPESHRAKTQDAQRERELERVERQPGNEASGLGVEREVAEIRGQKQREQRASRDGTLPLRVSGDGHRA